ncbi:metallophosphoesterase [Burkholderia ubonensis]|uniref:metallophosphoesterase n=1 Tax=Burkholderia ubonensis TaxID=101571 RepID=UPI0007572FB5|nr:metallophosphoesterase [Burkholderia ubonensis]KVO11733.1 hypothetical protein WJ73_19485 [Burkholderia ubonensis]
MSSLVKYFEINKDGRDFAVGDIHGHFTRLEKALERIGFDRARDRLFSVGDLVDRGPESDQVLQYLDEPWFHAVRGNHEDMAIHWPNGNMDSSNYVANGGAWNVANPPQVARAYADGLSNLPIAMTVETSDGKIGIVHADCPFPTWRDFVVSLDDRNVSNGMRKAIFDAALWSRERIQNGDQSGIPDVRAVVVGHTPLQRHVALGNVYHIDTGGWFASGHFTFLNLQTLEALPVPTDVLNWGGE